tara:strand:+ start:96 stop:908 length:813 start_codon:yes stop_codon:yes gene_type:complete
MIKEANTTDDLEDIKKSLCLKKVMSGCSFTDDQMKRYVEAKDVVNVKQYQVPHNACKMITDFRSELNKSRLTEDEDLIEKYQGLLERVDQSIDETDYQTVKRHIDEQKKHGLKLPDDYTYNEEYKNKYKEDAKKQARENIEKIVASRIKKVDYYDDVVAYLRDSKLLKILKDKLDKSRLFAEAEKHIKTPNIDNKDALEQIRIKLKSRMNAISWVAKRIANYNSKTKILLKEVEKIIDDQKSPKSGKGASTKKKKNQVAQYLKTFLKKTK